MGLVAPGKVNLTHVTSLSMHIGPVASGAAVIADSSLLDAVKGQHRRLLAIEMKAYGVLAAVEESTQPQPAGFVIKSVCDFANESALALQHFVEEYL